MLEKTAQVSSPPKSPDGFVYQRHKPEEPDLYKIIEQNLPSFQSHLSNADISLPAFVHDEFRNYLRCGLLKHGFLRVKCNGFRFEHLVVFSCKLRGFCPSCGARRMVEKQLTGTPDRSHPERASTTLGTQFSLASTFAFRSSTQPT